MIIIGSTALKHQGIDLRNGAESDIDVIVSDPLYTLGNGFKTDPIVLPEEIIKLFPTVSGAKIYNLPFATIDAIYTLKLSHLAWDIKWQKHKNDVLKLRKLGAIKLVKLHDDLVKHWNTVNTDKNRLSLYQTKANFFDDAVPHIFDHDYLHEVVALPDKPTYSLVLKDDQEVAIDREKFLKLPEHLQLRMFKEEITVIAAERWLIPQRNKKFHWLHAYSMAVHKTITALTKGWATQFMIDNLDYYLKPDRELFNNLEEKGIIKLGEILSKKEYESLLLEIMIAAIHAEAIKIGVPIEEARIPEKYELWMQEAVAIDIEDFEFDGNKFAACEDMCASTGMGEYAYSIFSWKGKHYKFSYSYYSEDGAIFDDADIRPVKPQQVTVTKYI